MCVNFPMQSMKCFSDVKVFHVREIKIIVYFNRAARRKCDEVGLELASQEFPRKMSGS